MHEAEFTECNGVNVFKSGSGPLVGNLWTASKGFVTGTLEFVRVVLPLLKSGYERLSEKSLGHNSNVVVQLWAATLGTGRGW